MTAGCKTVHNKTIINNKVDKEEVRRQRCEEIKLMGNNAFKSGHYNQAEEYYTSALLEYDQVVFFLTSLKWLTVAMPLLETGERDKRER